MNASDLIGLKLVHTTAPDISGEITDVLFTLSLEEAVFLLADVTTPDGTAPVLFSPTVLVLEDGILKTNAHPDDVKARVDASIHRMKVPFDPAGLPMTIVGPFGNTIAPSMIAALFNARTAEAQATPPAQENGVWFSQLKGSAVRVHVADVGHINDVVLDDQLVNCTAVQLDSFESKVRTFPPQAIRVEKSGDDTLLLSLTQADLSP